MPRFSANISMLFKELEFPERFEAAAQAGFKAVEIQFPYAWDKGQLARIARHVGVEVVLINIPAGDSEKGDRGIGCLPSRIREFRDAVGKAIEMPRHGERTFCCGAGGARMWMEEKRGRPINQERAREAAATGADTLAVACPFCTVMLDDGIRETGAKMQVIDLATLLAEAVEKRRNLAT